MPTNYYVPASTLSDIADAIRAKGGTTSSMSYPIGFISAINDISGGSVSEPWRLLSAEIASRKHLHFPITTEDDFYKAIALSDLDNSVIEKSSNVYISTKVSARSIYYLTQNYSNYLTINKYGVSTTIDYNTCGCKSLSYTLTTYVKVGYGKSSTYSSQFQIMFYNSSTASQTLKSTNSASIVIFGNAKLNYSINAYTLYSTSGNITWERDINNKSVYLTRAGTYLYYQRPEVGTYWEAIDYEDIYLGNISAVWYSSEAFMNNTKIRHLYGPSVLVFGSSTCQFASNLLFVDAPLCETIHNYAFGGCYNLSEINMPQISSITGNQNFVNCSQLRSVTFGGSLSYIPNTCFGNCINLEFISASYVYSLGASAFCNCQKLSEVHFGDLEKIETSSVFTSCGFVEINRSNFPYLYNISSTAGYTFASNSQLTTVSLCNNVYTSAIYLSCSYAFAYCPNLETVTLENAHIANSYTFVSCGKLHTLYFSGDCHLGSAASTFSRCYSLKSVYINMSTIMSVGLDTFLSTGLTSSNATTGEYGSIFVPTSLYDQYIVADRWSYFADRFVSYEF